MIVDIRRGTIAWADTRLGFRLSLDNRMCRKSSCVHSGPDLTNKVLDSCQFFVSDPELGCQHNDGLLSSQQLVLHPCTFLFVSVADRSNITQQFVTSLWGDLLVAGNNELLVGIKT